MQRRPRRGLRDPLRITNALRANAGLCRPRWTWLLALMAQLTPLLAYDLFGLRSVQLLPAARIVIHPVLEIGLE